MNNAYVLAQSLLTPLGDTTQLVNTAISARINTYRSLKLLGDDEPPIMFSAVPNAALKNLDHKSLPGLNSAQIRRLQLAATALNSLPVDLIQKPLPLFLGAPQAYYPQNIFTSEQLNFLSEICGIPFDTVHSRVCSIGRASGFYALDMAFRYFAATGAYAAIVGGVDSYHDMRTLSLLDDQQRLLGRGGIDGFVPGEAAAFLLVLSEEAPERLRQQSHIAISRPALSEGNQKGALSQVVTTASVELDQPLQSVYSSENGESGFATETTLARLRNSQQFNEQTKILRPAEFFGDLGAAFTAVCLTLMNDKLPNQNQGARLLMGMSDDGYCGATVVAPNA